MSDVAIRVEHLSKMYKLGVINNGTLWKDIQTWAALRLGKEDPHSKIGQDKYAGDADHFWALKDISFDIAQGDRVGIIGRNGAGKSTLLKILSRITAPTEGIIKIRGKIASLLEVGTGFHGELTGRENIYLNGAILGMKKRQIDRRLDQIIAFSEIEHHIDTPVKRYSSGMYVRLAFAVAAHLDSDILIADEVLAVGDASFQKKALGKMQELSTGQGRTVLFVSHQIGAIKNLCNSGILLEQGVIASVGKIDTVLEQYLTQRRTGAVVRFPASNDRSPVRKAAISSIGMHDANNGSEKSTFSMGEDFTIRIRIDCFTKINALGVNVRVSTIDGVNLCAFRARESYDGLITVDKGEVAVLIRVQNPNLFNGTYQISLSIDESNQVIEHYESCLCFYIIPSQVPCFPQKIVSSENTLVFMKSEWMIE